MHLTLVYTTDNPDIRALLDQYWGPVLFGAESNQKALMALSKKTGILTSQLADSGHLTTGEVCSRCGKPELLYAKTQFQAAKRRTSPLCVVCADADKQQARIERERVEALAREAAALRAAERARKQEERRLRDDPRAALVSNDALLEAWTAAKVAPWAELPAWVRGLAYHVLRDFCAGTVTRAELESKGADAEAVSELCLAGVLVPLSLANDFLQTSGSFKGVSVVRIRTYAIYANAIGLFKVNKALISTPADPEDIKALVAVYAAEDILAATRRVCEQNNFHLPKLGKCSGYWANQMEVLYNNIYTALGSYSINTIRTALGTCQWSLARWCVEKGVEPSRCLVTLLKSFNDRLTNHEWLNNVKARTRSDLDAPSQMLAGLMQYTGLTDDASLGAMLIPT